MRFTVMCDNKDKVDARKFFKKARVLCDNAWVRKDENNIIMNLCVSDRGLMCGRKISKMEQYINEFEEWTDTNPVVEISF